MAKPNPNCPKCHGTGWALKPGTQTQSPCRVCVDAQDAETWDFFHDKSTRNEEAITTAFPDYPE